MGKNFKKHLILTMGKSAEIKEIQNNKLILVTSFGIIQGRLMPENPKNLPSKIYSEFLTLAQQHWSENVGQPELSDEYVLLSDVEIKTGPNTFNTPFLMVFYDQIIGVTVGNFD